MRKSLSKTSRWARSAPRMACLCLLAAGLSSTPITSFGASKAKEVLKLNKPFGTKDLTLKFWQQEDNIDVINFTVSGRNNLPAIPTSQGFGDQPGTNHTGLKNLPGLPPSTNPDNGKHAVDVVFDNLNLSAGQVEVNFEWTLTHWNTKRVVTKWSKPAKDDSYLKTVPGFGWTVADPVDVGGGQYSHTVTISNDDELGLADSMVLYLHGLSYDWLSSGELLSFDALGSWTQWTPAPSPNLTLQPGESYTFDVLTPGTGGQVLGFMEIWDQSNISELIQDYWLHEVPEPTTAVLLGVGGLLALGSRKRHRR
jgi:hypothetical protein